MRRIWAIIQREARENLRQRWLLITLGGQLGIIATGGIAVLWGLDWFSRLPSGDLKLQYWSDVLGMPMTMQGLVGLVVGALDYLVLTQLLGMTAVLAGHAALHDRQTGTLPFLLLAPVRRGELLVGKILGALAVPLLFYVAIGGATMIGAASMEVTSGHAPLLPPSGGWMVAFWLGAPSWAACIAALCVAISSQSRDVRTAQQAAWVLVFVATFIVGPLLVNLMAAGAIAQLVVAGLGLALALAAGILATVVFSRDLGR